MSVQRVGDGAVRLHRRYHFSASHRLHVDHLSEGQNRALFGKCNNPFGHGHNYVLQVTLGGPIAPETGMLVDLAALDRYVQEEVLDRFDLANLNQDEAFSQVVPSTENLALHLWQRLLPFATAHAPSRLCAIRVEETGNNAFDYFGELPAPGLATEQERHAAPWQV